METYLGVFGIALVSEALATRYTQAVARNELLNSALCTIFLSIINYGILVFIIDNHALAVPGILGELIGNVGAMWLSRRRR